MVKSSIAEVVLNHTKQDCSEVASINVQIIRLCSLGKSGLTVLKMALLENATIEITWGRNRRYQHFFRA